MRDCDAQPCCSLPWPWPREADALLFYALWDMAPPASVGSGGEKGTAKGEFEFEKLGKRLLTLSVLHVV